MTKEPIEILSEVSGLLPSTIERNYKWVLEAMKLYAEQDSIDFAEWAAINGYSKVLGEKQWYKFNETKSTEQLYQLFLESKK